MTAAEAAVRAHAARVEASPAATRRAFAATLEAWGGQLAPGVPEGFTLPVVAGLRRGRASCRLEVLGTTEGSEVRLAVEREELHVNWSATAVLALAAAGGLVSMAWAWVPALLPAVPLGLVLAVGGWLLIAARLRSAGAEEFLAAVQAAAEGAAEES